jgi:hypothetical protein
MMSAAPAEAVFYPQRFVADQIADRLTKIKGQKHGVIKLPQGFQVVQITVCPAYMPPAKPKPVLKTNPVEQLVAKPGEYLMSFTLVGEGMTYITVSYNGKSMAFGKSTLLGWKKDEGSNTITLHMSTAVAKKRGLI